MRTPALLEVDFGHGLNLSRAESAIETLASVQTETAEIVLDFRNIRHVEIGAGWRIGNALRPLSTKVHLRIILPNSLDERDHQYKFFTHSGLGLAIGKYADTITKSGSDVKEAFRAYYTSPRDTGDIGIPCWRSSTLLLIPSLHLNALPTDEPARFNRLLHKLLANTLLDVRAYSGFEMDGLYQMLFEAVQNVWDHADRHPLPSDSEVLSYLAVRYFKQVNPPSSLTPEFAAYRSRATTLMKLSKFEHEGFIEIAVVDDGVGIAARQTQEEGVYEGDFDNELQALTNAFSSGGSVKLSTHDANLRGSPPGYGFAKIVKALTSLSGFALVRTGRALAFYDGTGNEQAFEALASPLGTLPGTVLQVVLPRRIPRVWSVPEDD